MVVMHCGDKPVFSSLTIKIRNFNTVGYKLQYPSVNTMCNVCMCGFRGSSESKSICRYVIS
jgi:hypothetical protein